MTKPSQASEAVAMVAGALAGASTGLIAGPLGAAFGAVLGGAIGGSAGLAIDLMEKLVQRRNARLDRDIGVMGGDLGAGGALTHPSARAGGLYSASSAGTSSVSERAPVEGPIPEAE